MPAVFKRCIAKITEHRWDRNLPEPADWDVHDEAVSDLLERIDNQVHGHHPRVIAETIRDVLNNELENEPEIFAHLIAYLGFILDGRLRNDDQMEHARKMWTNSE